MKTILWIYNHPLNPEAGGTERITSIIMRGLSAKGYNCMGILVIESQTGKTVYQGKNIENIYDFLTKQHVDVVINQAGHTEDLLKFFLANGGKRWKDEGGRIISCLHFNPIPTSICYSFQSKKNKGLHDYYVIAKTWLLQKHLAKKDKERIGKIYRYIYDSSDAFVLLSNTFKAYVTESIGIASPSKLIAINNPLTFEDISDISVLTKKKNVILIVARMLDWQKRISLALKTWKKIAKSEPLLDWQLTIVGDGPDLKDFKQYTSLNGLERVSFLGQRNPEHYYEEAKVFLMTSKVEGWGLTLTESLQRGVVPIAFNTSTSFPEIIANGYNGYLIDDGNIKAFKRAIIDIASNDNLYTTMAKNALLSAEHFKLEGIIEKWEKII